MSGWKLAHLDIPRKAVAAPLAGYSDVAFRDSCARMQAGITYTEMVSAKGLVYGSDKTKELLATSPAEGITAVQLFGSEPYYMQAAAEHEAIEKFDIIDINMGCPVPKVVNNGEGSALLARPDTAQAVVRAALQAGKPVTVKMRIGIDERTPFDAVGFALRMQDAGAASVTVHGRTRRQMYAGHADWDAIARVVDALEIPVVANGDVTDEDSYARILEHTGAAAVMIGRGALGNPWLFGRLAGMDVSRNAEDIARHLRTSLDYFPPAGAVKCFRKHFMYYCRGMRDSNAAKVRAFACVTPEEMLDCIYDTFATCQENN